MGYKNKEDEKEYYRKYYIKNRAKILEYHHKIISGLCADCQKPIRNPKAKRCRVCASKMMLGVKRPPAREETKNKMRNENNPQWKGNKVKYRALHCWVRKYKPKTEHCEECKKIIKLEIANISGLYKRDISDYNWLCKKCHLKRDGAAFKDGHIAWNKDTKGFMNSALKGKTYEEVFGLERAKEIRNKQSIAALERYKYD